MFGIMEIMAYYGTLLLHPFPLLLTVHFYPSLSVNIWLISTYGQGSYTIYFAMFKFYLPFKVFMLYVIRLHPVPQVITVI